MSPIRWGAHVLQRCEKREREIEIGEAGERDSITRGTIRESRRAFIYKVGEECVCVYAMCVCWDRQKGATSREIFLYFSFWDRDFFFWDLFFFCLLWRIWGITISYRASGEGREEMVARMSFM